MIYLSVNCQNFTGLVWRRQTKFQIGMTAAVLAIPLRRGIGDVYVSQRQRGC